MAVTVKYNLIGLQTLQKFIRPFTNKLVFDISKEAPKRIAKSIRTGTSGIDDTKALPINAPSTINRKIQPFKT